MENEKKENISPEHLASFNKLVNAISKVREVPYGIRYGFTCSSIFSENYSIDDINDAKNNLDIQAMREISNFYYKTS